MKQIRLTDDDGRAFGLLITSTTSLKISEEKAPLQEDHVVTIRYNNLPLIRLASEYELDEVLTMVDDAIGGM